MLLCTGGDPAVPKIQHWQLLVLCRNVSVACCQGTVRVFQRQIFCPQQMEVTACSCKQKPNNSKKGHDCVETVAQTKLMMLLRQMCTRNTLWRECAMSSEGPRTFSWSTSRLSMHISSYVSWWYIFLISAGKYLCVHTSYVDLYEHTVFPEMLCTHLMFYCENPFINSCNLCAIYQKDL